MRKNGLSNEQIAHLCRGLSVLLHAGISLNAGLFLLGQEEEGSFKTLLQELGEMTDEGLSFSQALEKQECLPVYATGLIKVGEHTGHLEEALNALEEYYEGQARLMTHLKNTLTYPAILLVLMMAVIGILFIKVLPIFKEVYEALGVTFTGIAKGLIFAGERLGACLPILYAILIVLLTGILLFAESEAIRSNVFVWSRRKFGNHGIAKKINHAHFAQALTMGLKSGMVIEEAVELAGELLKDVPQAAANCKCCAEKIKEGEALGNALKETDILPASACRMLEIGMRGGNGDHVMEGIAERMMTDAEMAVMEKISKIEPVMVTITSMLVGIILLSVMLPLINMMSAIG